MSVAATAREDSRITDGRRAFKDVSYSKHKRTAVFAQWQRELLAQQYEACCHWAAEIDCSLWQDVLWERIVLVASKHVHLHCPKVVLLVAQRYRDFLRTTTKTAHTAPMAMHERRNNPALRRNLAQVLGVLCFSEKGPVYQLPKVDAHRIDVSKLPSSLHPWVVPHRRSGDNELVLKFISAIVRSVEAHTMHKALFWLSALMHFEKQLKKERKLAIDMAPRTIEGLELGKHARDWIWLLWTVLSHAPPTAYEPRLKRSLDDLTFLFSRGFTTGKKSSRAPLTIHAMLLLSASTAPGGIDWSGTVFPNMATAQMVDSALRNIDIMYRDIKRKALVQQEGERIDAMGAASATSPPPGMMVAAQVPAVAPLAVAPAPVAAPAPAPSVAKKKGKGGEMPIASIDKMAIVDAIDAALF